MAGSAGRAGRAGRSEDDVSMQRQKAFSRGIPAPTSAMVASGLLLLVGSFQAALAAGAPLGPAAYGGAVVGRLPSRLRASSAVTSDTKATPGRSPECDDGQGLHH